MKSDYKQIKSKKRVREFGEVYTQEREVKAMLDLVKEESYRIDSLFLEPTCGNGNFLVEILKRKLTVSQNKEEVITSLSSIYAIDILEDNIVESKKRLYELVKDNLTQEEALFIMNQNIVCGDSLELLNHSPYIEMKFDVIIGNPPYQLNDGGHGASAMPLYHKFVQQAKKLNPKYLTMIIKANWYSTGRGLDEFRIEMLNDKRIKKIVDFPNSNVCFLGTDIEGGVCYFLWDNNYQGDCEVVNNNEYGVSIARRPLKVEGLSTFIRYNESASILEKVLKFKEPSFSNLASTQKPFGLRTYEEGLDIPFENSIILYGNQKRKFKSYINQDIVTKNQNIINSYKVLMTKAYGSGKNAPYKVLNTPILSEPGSCCTESYIVLGVYNSEDEAKNVISYINSKFFRFLVLLKKPTQDAARGVYEFVPLQDFSKPWTDQELYEKYGLTQEEINYIESMIRPMN